MKARRPARKVETKKKEFNQDEWLKGTNFPSQASAPCILSYTLLMALTPAARASPFLPRQVHPASFLTPYSWPSPMPPRPLSCGILHLEPLIALLSTSLVAITNAACLATW